MRVLVGTVPVRSSSAFIRSLYGFEGVVECIEQVLFEWFVTVDSFGGEGVSCGFFVFGFASFFKCGILVPAVVVQVGLWAFGGIDWKVTMGTFRVVDGIPVLRFFGESLAGFGDGLFCFLVFHGDGGFVYVEYDVAGVVSDPFLVGLGFSGGHRLVERVGEC